MAAVLSSDEEGPKKLAPAAAAVELLDDEPDDGLEERAQELAEACLRGLKPEARAARIAKAMFQMPQNASLAPTLRGEAQYPGAATASCLGARTASDTARRASGSFGAFRTSSSTTRGVEEKPSKIFFRALFACK